MLIDLELLVVMSVLYDRVIRVVVGGGGGCKGVDVGID